MAPRPLLVVADDLTGACDTAGTIATAVRAPVPVLLVHGRAPRAAVGAHPVLALDIDSRSAPVAVAVERTVDAVAAATGDVYLKIDSTLRGHVVDTVAAAAGAFRALHPGSRVVVCPAFPGRDRVVRDRRVVVAGEVLPASALRELAAVPGIVVADAATDEDLAALAAAAPDAPTLWAGSAGLAPHVAARAAADAGSRPVPGASGAVPVPTRGPIAVVVGSNQAASVAAAAALTARADDRVRVVVGDPRRDSFADGAADAAADAVALVVTGGYTARRLLDRLGIDEVVVGGELEPGIPWETSGRLTVVTKAGGFGDEGTLARLVDRLLTR